MKQLEVDLSLLPDHLIDRPYAHLQAWYLSVLDTQSDKLYYKDAAVNQFMFLRDQPINIFGIDNVESIEVISTHMSKSVTLPVYHIKLKPYNTSLIIRGNFHDYKVSVKTDIELNFPIELFTKSSFYDNKIPSCYCEGFKEDWVYDSYKLNNKQFTVELYSSYDLYVFFFLLSLQLK